jgi:hypothetical protein
MLKFRFIQILTFFLGGCLWYPFFWEKTTLKRTNFPKSLIGHSSTQIQKEIFFFDFFCRVISNLVKGSLGQFPTKPSRHFVSPLPRTPGGLQPKLRVLRLHFRPRDML